MPAHTSVKASTFSVLEERTVNLPLKSPVTSLPTEASGLIASTPPHILVESGATQQPKASVAVACF